MSLIRSLFGRRANAEPAAATQKPSSTRSAAEWRSLGNEALGGGQTSEAAAHYLQATQADPGDALGFLNLGFAQLELGNAVAAQEAFARALVLRRPDQEILHELHYLLGRSYRMQGDAIRAASSFEAAVQVMPAFAEPMADLADLMYAEGKAAQSLAWARRLQAVQPSTSAEILIAQALYLSGSHEEAMTILDAIVEREPGWPSAWTGRGHVLLATKKAHAAAESYERALSLLRTPDALANTAAALNSAGRHDAALQRVDEALQLDPTHRNSLFNRSSILLALVRPVEAAEACARGLALYPGDADLHWNHAIALLMLGRFEEGWREHEWRWKARASRAKHLLVADSRQWTGREDLSTSTILLMAEQGFGDSFQMLRYVPLVAARAHRVLLHLPVGLHGLALTHGLAPGVTLLAPGEELPAFDWYCPLMSLPLAFGSSEHSIPREVPYLKAEPDRVAAWRRRLESAQGRLTVGVVWSGSAAHVNDQNRSMAFADVRAHMPTDVFLVGLQKDVRTADRPALDNWPDLHNWGEELADFDDTAALIEALDLVVTVDTSVAHLAGALGRPVWMVLPQSPDWRWMLGREDSPWYPTMRLFRQKTAGDWAELFGRLRAELAAQR